MLLRRPPRAARSFGPFFATVSAKIGSSFFSRRTESFKRSASSVRNAGQTWPVAAPGGKCGYDVVPRVFDPAGPKNLVFF